MTMLTPEKIRAIREALGMTLTEFAYLLAVAANTVARWEKGDRHPSYAMMVKLTKLAEKKGIDLSDKTLAKAR